MTQRTDYFEDKDAIVTAVRLCDFDAAELLVSRGVGINEKNESGQTAIFVAIEEDWAGTEWVEFLIKNGADINILDSDGDSVLDVARFHKRTDIVELLLANGAKGKDGPSVKQLRDDEIYAAFQHANAVKRLFSESKNKKP